MKKIILSFVLIITSTVAFSQVTVSPGVKTGLNMSNLSNFGDSDTQLGLQGGLFLNIHLAKFYELQVETIYSQQGATFKYRSLDSTNGDPFVNSNNEFDLSLDYLSLNITNKFFPFKDLGLNFMVGPGIDILVNSNNFNDATPIDFTIFGGVGYEFPFGLGLELRYKQGLIDIRDDYYEFYDENDNDFYEDENVLNGVIQLGVTYKFSFNK